MATSVKQEVLLLLRNAGIVSEILEARLQYAEAAQLLNQHIKPMIGLDRVYPNMMTPQASGRMSVSDPPLGNFTGRKKYGPHGIRDVVRPDPGWRWLIFDWEAVEARIVSHRSRDTIDAEAYRRMWDIHTVTAMRMFKWPEPSFEPTKANLKSSAGQEWCEHIGHLAGMRDSEGRIISWNGDHRLRTLAKNCRYCLQYAQDVAAMDRYAAEMKMDKMKLRHFGALYLASKPWLVAWKRERWASAWRLKEARTAFGRRRRLVGKRKDVEKEGLNHEVQGTVADLMKMTLRRIKDRWPESRLAYQSHDGAKIAFPGNLPPRPDIQAIVEREVIIDGRPVSFPAEYGEM